MIEHPCKDLRLSIRAREAFEDIARGNDRGHAQGLRAHLLRVGLIMRRTPGRNVAGDTIDPVWILTPDAWAQWTEYERQLAAEYVESEELQPATDVAITKRERSYG